MKPSWTDINAYVDGELEPEAAADVARTVADDRTVAGQVAALARLKAVSAEVMAVPPEMLPALRVGRSPPPRRRWRPAAAAAAVVLALAAGAFWGNARQPDPAGAWLDRVGERHARWLAADAEPAPAAGPAATAVRSGFGTDAIPDLGAMRLAVAHVATSTLDGRPVLYVGYVGVRGCRLGLWVGPAPAELPSGLVEHREDGTRILSWRVGDTGYAAVARGMDANRLRAVADRLQTLSRGSDKTRLAGTAGEAGAAPCLG